MRELAIPERMVDSAALSRARRRSRISGVGWIEVTI
jgi:hypothetical protein